MTDPPSPAAFRFFVAILALCQSGSRVTVEAIADRLGLRSSGSVHRHLKPLRGAGWIAWEIAADGEASAASIRPLYRLELRRAT
jgi:predicted ArsR family transcriptional regulator